MTYTVKDSAHEAVYEAVKRGALVRPDICERCGKRPGLTSAGRSMIHGHHHDYSKPLSVEWLCAGCHRLISCEDGSFSGKNNVNCHFSAEDISKIRRLRKNGVSQYKIAKIVGCSPGYANKVFNGHFRRHG